MTRPMSQQRLARAFVDLAASPVTEPSDTTGLLAALAAHGTELLGDCTAIVLYVPDEHAPAEVAGIGAELMRLAHDSVGWDEGLDRRPGTPAARFRTPPSTATGPAATGRATRPGPGSWATAGPPPCPCTWATTPWAP